ncbi:hypothetical protein GCM10010339_13600 [Streptomyces alanosinicus]|uniref:Uncharacterized protein n=1 Tax=Streptomyces alanosinicus TaxID=68171 RepID=A0A918YFA7_9ACTN|nr:hypothetical protein GCM10010339_13600 [Streptomyces alanosinicus]
MSAAQAAEETAEDAREAAQKCGERVHMKLQSHSGYYGLKTIGPLSEERPGSRDHSYEQAQTFPQWIKLRGQGAGRPEGAQAAGW